MATALTVAADAPARSAIRFVLNGEIRDVEGVAPTATLLDFLRNDLRLTGTKEGCAEGDCGACTVAVGRLGADGAVVWRPANACILFLGMLDGAAVATVEALTSDGALDPVQEAMVARHGSQCGFCTPGIVMAIYAARLNAGPTPPSRDALADALAGNLCRCTGYGPILTAAADAFAAPRPEADLAARARDAALIAELAADRRSLAMEGAAGAFFAPRSLDEAAALASSRPGAVLVNGATDVGLWATKALRDMPEIIHLGQVAELKRIEETPDGGLILGAGVTYAEAEAAIAARWPDFAELIRRVGSPQVRSHGAIGGNVANGSPIGDTPPALIALGARLRLRNGDLLREIALENFFIDYGQQDRIPGEIVESIVLPPGGDGLRCYKISKRFDQDISALCGCFNVTVENGVVTDARIAFGGVAGVPKRAAHVEQALIGQSWSLATAESAAEGFAQDYAPIDDHRASAGYRLSVARNLLTKYAMETGASGAGTPATRLVGRDAIAL